MSMLTLLVQSQHEDVCLHVLLNSALRLSQMNALQRRAGLELAERLCAHVFLFTAAAISFCSAYIVEHILSYYLYDLYSISRSLHFHGCDIFVSAYIVEHILSYYLYDLYSFLAYDTDFLRLLLKNCVVDRSTVDIGSGASVLQGLHHCADFSTT